jgi:hypothetical protein
MQSTVMGFMDRAGRNPHCRLTAFTRDHFPLYEAARPFVEEVSRLFQQYAPTRWQAQHEFIARVSPEFRIPDTVFTTVTVNRNERTATHMDANDYRGGFGVMAVLEDARYVGGELIFPKYRTGVDMRMGGLCLADVHQWHGNAPLIGIGRRFVRLALIFYAREHMHACGSVEEERHRAAVARGPLA